jgi:flagellar motor switch protein FliG
MDFEKKLVVTAYGHDDVIDEITISLFDGPSGGYWSNEHNSRTYCDTLNSLDLQGNSWVYAKAVPVNTPVNIKVFLPIKFTDLILGLDDWWLQRLFGEFDTRELAVALTGCSEAVLEKSFKNMSCRIAQDIKKDMEQFPRPSWQIQDSRNKIIDVARSLEKNGCVINHSKGKEESK